MATRSSSAFSTVRRSNLWFISLNPSHCRAAPHGWSQRSWTVIASCGTAPGANKQKPFGLRWGKKKREGEKNKKSDNIHLSAAALIGIAFHFPSASGTRRERRRWFFKALWENMRSNSKPRSILVSFATNKTSGHTLENEPYWVERGAEADPCRPRNGLCARYHTRVDRWKRGCLLSLAAVTAVLIIWRRLYLGRTHDTASWFSRLFICSWCSSCDHLAFHSSTRSISTQPKTTLQCM